MDLKNGFADRTSKSESKSKSIAFKSKSKSKSSKNGLKSGLESKSGLEYYKSAHYVIIITWTLLIDNLKLKLYFNHSSRLCWVADWFQLYELHCRPKQCKCIGQTPCSLEHYLVFLRQLLFGYLVMVNEDESLVPHTRSSAWVKLISYAHTYGVVRSTVLTSSYWTRRVVMRVLGVCAERMEWCLRAFSLDCT